MNINFTGRIPIAKCQIKDRISGEQTPVTFFEYDCKDIEDSIEVKTARRIHSFKDTIAKYMAIKTEQIQNREKPNKERFFGLASKNSEIIGLAQTKADGKGVHIDFIETDFCRYKHVGRNMLALIGKYGIEDEKRLIIDCYTDGAYEFYTEKCKFKPFGRGRKLALGPKGIRKLIQSAQTKSKASFRDIR